MITIKGGGERMLLKNSLRKIKQSMGRYLSLFSIVFISIFLCAGILEAIPSIRKIQTDYYSETNLMDVEIKGTLGLTDKDVSFLKNIPEVDMAVGSYSKEVYSGDDVLRVHLITDLINGFKLIDGKMPFNADECLADSSFYKVGDVIKIVENGEENDLKYSEYKVVGTIMSPLYTGTDYGTVAIGNGKLKSYFYLLESSFSYDYYTEIYLTMKKVSEDIQYSDSYEKKLDNIIGLINNVKQEREEERLRELFGANYAEYGGEVNSDWYLFTRHDVVTNYDVISYEYDEIEVLASIVPIFFIVVAALMTSSTMTRMIVEERGEIGILDSLGLPSYKIIFNYLGYVLSATIVGSLIGYFLGTIVIPKLVYICFPLIIPPMVYHVNFGSLLLFSLAASLLMILVTVFSCRKELKNSPASLLRPKAPKAGEKIIIEKVPFIWDKLSFSWKVTLRNIARYKSRVAVTLIGTAGCTLLIMIGFSIKDSIDGVGERQYTEIHCYDNIVAFSASFEDTGNIEKLGSGVIENPLFLNQTYFNIDDGNSYFNVTLLSPEEDSLLFSKYFNLLDSKSHEKIVLNDNGVVITSKIAEKYQLKVGDIFTLENKEGHYNFKVLGIAENYVSNYVYISKKLYEDTFQKPLEYNLLVSDNLGNKDKIAQQMLGKEGIINISFSDDLIKSSNGGIKGLNYIVILLIFVSSLLSIAVLYNLTSINISERKREIATLKVLGFNDNETNRYIYRETMVTVMVGIILGIVISPFVHQMLIELLENDTISFLRGIRPVSFIVTFLLVFIFTIIMQLVTYIRLKGVNMIESLKSVE